MRHLTFLIFATLILVPMAEGTDTPKDPLWSRGVQDDVNLVTISENGEYIAASTDSELLLFDKSSNSWSYSASPMRDIAISADGEYIAASGYDDSIYLFDKDSNEPLWSHNLFDTGQSVGWHSISISADGEYIAAKAYDELLFFSKDSYEPLWTVETDYRRNASIAISANGEYIAVGSDELTFFSKDSNESLWNYDLEGWVRSISFSDGGKYIAVGTEGSGAQDNQIYLFDKDSNTLLWSHNVGNRVYSVSISADGDYIAAGSDDKGVWLFDNDGGSVDNKQPLWIYDAEGQVRSVSISADGKFLSACSGRSLHLFGKDSSTPLWSWTNTFGGGYVNSAAISADGNYIAAGSDDSIVYLFENKDSMVVWRGGGETTDDSSKILDGLPIFQIGVAAILACLFYIRRGTGYENPFNKVLKIILYGIAIISFLIAVIMVFLTLMTVSDGSSEDEGERLISDPEDRRIWLWWMTYAMLFALTASFLGDESYSYSYTPQSQKLGQTSTSSKPIFANRRRTPMFTPEKKLANIECPGCNAQMKVPKLGKMQNVTCKKCGLSGEIEI